MKKTFVVLIICLVLSILFSMTACADKNNIKVILNGKQLNFDVLPTMIQDRVMLPVRTIFEALEATVEWEEDTNTITGIKGSKKVTLKIGDHFAHVDNYIVTMDAPPIIIDGITLVPVRIISEVFGAIVEWDEELKAVNITSDLKVLPVNEKDFDVTYRNLALKVGDSPNEMLEKLGQGQINKGDSVNSLGYRDYLHNYTDGESKIVICVKVNEETKDSFIGCIDVSDFGTDRSLKVGCNRNDLIKGYGEPTERTGSFGQGWIYIHNENKLLFIFGLENKVDAIFIYGKWGL